MLYAADGTLLQRKYLQNNAVKHKIDYIDDKEYHKDTLEYIHHGQGRMIKHNATWQYEYSIKDHLGNVRATFCDLNNNGIISNNERRSRLDYYTFGMEHYSPYTESQYSVAKNNYKYNGKEVIEEMNVGLYNYHARYMNPEIGRFTTLDPLAAKYLSHTGYNYVLNNAISNIDPDGMEISTVNGGVHFTGNDAIEVFNIIAGKTKNVLVYIEPDAATRKQMNSKDKMGINGAWSVFAVSDLLTAARALDIITDFTLNNLILTNHGNSDTENSYFEYGTGNKSLDSKNSITTDEIAKFNRANGGSIRPLLFKQIANKVKDGGNIIFAFCFTGAVGERTLTELARLTGKRLNVFLPYAYATFGTQNWNENSGKSLSTNKNIGGFSGISPGKSDFRSVNITITSKFKNPLIIK